MSITPARISYKIYQGSTFKETFRWESQNKNYIQISNISKSAPCIITTANTHTLPQNWRFRVTDVVGMNQINQISEDQYYLATTVGNNTISVNSLNSSNYSNYTSGGIISYNLPVPIAGYSAVMQFRETLDSPTTIYQLTSAPNGGIIIDSTNYTITITIPASVTTNFSFNTAIYGLELTSSSGEVFPLITGTAVLVKEIVR